MLEWVLLEILLVAVLLWLVLRDSHRWKRRAAGRIPAIDFLKGTAIICVIAIHVADLYPQVRWLNIWLLAAIPVFVFASGYVLGTHYLERFQAKRYFERIIVRIGIPYLLWSIVMLWLEGASARDFPAALLFGRANSNFYFIPLLLGLYLLFPLIQRYKKQLLSTPALICGYGITVLAKVWHTSLTMQVWNANEWSLIFFGRYLFYFLIGIRLSQYSLPALPWRALLSFIAPGIVLTVVLSAAAGYRILPVFLPLSISLLLVILHKKVPWLLAPIVLLGPHTLVMYFVHTRFVYTWGGAQLAAQHTTIGGYGVVLIFVTGTAYVIAWMASKVSDRVMQLYA